MVANPKLSDILRDLPHLSLDVDEKTHVATLNDVHMVVTQVTAEQGANIEAFWKNTMYAMKNGKPNIQRDAKVCLRERCRNVQLHKCRIRQSPCGKQRKRGKRFGAAAAPQPCRQVAGGQSCRCS